VHRQVEMRLADLWGLLRMSAAAFLRQQVRASAVLLVEVLTGQERGFTVQSLSEIARGPRKGGEDIAISIIEAADRADSMIWSPLNLRWGSQRIIPLAMQGPTTQTHSLSQLDQSRRAGEPD